MFSTRNGLYERARQRFKVTDGIKLFSYPFYKQRRMDVQVRPGEQRRRQFKQQVDSCTAAQQRWLPM